MNNEERKIMTFIVKLLCKIINHSEITDNDYESLYNIAADLSVDDLEDDAFRY